MMRSTIFALVIATVGVSPIHAAPILEVADSYGGTNWRAPAKCRAGTETVLSPACLPSITTIAAPSKGYRLNRANTAPAAASSTRTAAFDNGVMAVGVESIGPASNVASAHFVETYHYIGPASTPFLVPFTIDRFSLATNTQFYSNPVISRMQIGIGVITGSRYTNVANLDYYALSDSRTAFAWTSSWGPGMTLSPGFVAVAGVNRPKTIAEIAGPGGIMTVNLGTFAVGQAFTLDYRMSCSTSGSGIVIAHCNVGDPFAIPSGPGFDLMGKATAVPEPGTWLMMIIGFGLAGGALRARRARAARAGSGNRDPRPRSQPLAKENPGC